MFATVLAAVRVSAAEPQIVKLEVVPTADPKLKTQGQMLAGDEFSVFFDVPPVNLKALHVGLVNASNTLTVLPRLVARENEVRIRLPKDQPVGIYKVIYTEKAPSSPLDQWTDAAYSVVVWPVPNATISDISPKTVRPGTSVKVTGTGFTAPATQISLQVGGIPARIDRVDPDGRWFAASVQESEQKGVGAWLANMIRPQRGVQVAVWGIPAAWPDDLVMRIERPVRWLWTTLLFVGSGALVGLIFWLIRCIYKTWPAARSWIAAALIEPKNNTYSLARAQFLWWLAIITWGYLFLFLGRGWVEGVWGFPPLAGFAYTFLISLGTLVGGEVTNGVRGVKGAGIVSPSPSDLIMHGGVLALERVQQVMWTVVVGLMFLFITVKTYATSTTMPTVPTELLTLMGFSSLGYLAGKTARKPGPVISSVAVAGSSLQIVGENFSATGARVQVDGQMIAGQITANKKPGATGDFAQELLVPLPEPQVNEWARKSHIVLVTNADEQFAEWKSLPRLATVRSIADVTASGTREIVIHGENIRPGAVLRTDDGKGGELAGVQDQVNPAVWKLTVDQTWPASAHVIELENADGTKSKVTWKADTTTGAEL